MRYKPGTRINIAVSAAKPIKNWHFDRKRNASPQFKAEQERIKRVVEDAKHED